MMTRLPPPPIRRHRSAAAALAVLIVAAGAGTATAQEKLFRTATTETGKQVRLGMYGDVGKDCAAGALPDVKVTTPPRHGTLDVKSGKTKAGRLKRCPSLEVPVQGVFYKPTDAYKGSDEAVFEVKRADGKTQVLTFKVEVGGAKAPAKDDADL